MSPRFRRFLVFAVLSVGLAAYELFWFYEGLGLNGHMENIAVWSIEHHVLTFGGRGTYTSPLPFTTPVTGTLGTYER